MKRKKKLSKTSPEQQWAHLDGGGAYVAYDEEGTVYTARGVVGEPGVYVLVSRSGDVPGGAAAVTTYPELLDLMAANASLEDWSMLEESSDRRKEADVRP